MSAARWTALANYYINRTVEEPVEEAEATVQDVDNAVVDGTVQAVEEPEHSWQLIQTVGVTVPNQAVDTVNAELERWVNIRLIEIRGDIVTAMIRYGALTDDLKNQIDELVQIAETRTDELGEGIHQRVRDLIADTQKYGATVEGGIVDRIKHDIEQVGERTVDAGTEFLGRALSDSITQSVGDILNKSIGGDVAKGTALGETIAAQMPEVVKKGSPSIRKNMESAVGSIQKELATTGQELVDKIHEKASPINPDISAALAATTAAGALGGLTVLTATGSAIEAASLGQLEIPGQFLMRLGGMYGLGKMAGAVVSVPYRWAVDIGFNQKMASIFQPSIPSMTDLVRMELREVWRDKERQEQLEEPPSTKFKELANLWGFSDFHADSFWAAHWALPSVSQAYEMFARLRPGRVNSSLVFGIEDLNSLLKRRDVLKRYRQQLISIAFEVPTRREIRMMVDAGTITRDEAEQMYLDRRVDPKFAGKLANFALARAHRDPFRQRLITAAIDLFKEGIWSEQKFTERLVTENVPASTIKEALDLGRIEFERDEWRDFIALKREEFRKKKITADDMLLALQVKGMVPVRAKLLVDREVARQKLT